MSGEIFLIDFENVQPTSIGQLKPGTCRIHVFVGQNQKSMAVELSQALQPLGTDVSYTRITGNGPNALDFHIAFYIGRLSVEHPTARFTIVSKDTGFDPLVKHIATLGTSCRRIAALPGAPRPAKAPAAAKPTGKKVSAPAAKAAARPRNLVTVLPAKGDEARPPGGGGLGNRAGIEDVVARLRGMKAARPTRLKTLQSSMLAWFRPALAANEVDAIIQVLADRNKITLDGAKLTYSLD